MQWGRGGRLRRLLSGVLVLSLILVSVAQVNALMLSVGNLYAATTAALDESDHHPATSSTAARDHGDHPCKGHQRSHGVTCCMSGGCPVLVIALPTGTRVPPPITPDVVRNLRMVAAQLDGIGRAPDLPPPRQMV